MPSYVIKCDRESDRYVYWSDIVGAPHMHGTREEIAEYLHGHERLHDSHGEVSQRLKRADETGSSALWGIYKFDGGGLIVEQRGLLPRERLWEFCEAYCSGDPDRRDEWLDMLLPFDDCDEHDSPTGNTCPVLPCPDHVVRRG